MASILTHILPHIYHGRYNKPSNRFGSEIAGANCDGNKLLANEIHSKIHYSSETEWLMARSESFAQYCIFTVCRPYLAASKIIPCCCTLYHFHVSEFRKLLSKCVFVCVQIQRQQPVRHDKFLLTMRNYLKILVHARRVPHIHQHRIVW